MNGQHIHHPFFTLFSNLRIWGKVQICIVVKCQIAWVTWWRQLLGTIQLRIPMWNRLSRTRSFTQFQSTHQSHSTPQIIFTYKWLLRCKLGNTSLHQQFSIIMGLLGSPFLTVPKMVSQATYNTLYQQSTKELQ